MQRQDAPTQERCESQRQQREHARLRHVDDGKRDRDPRLDVARTP